MIGEEHNISEMVYDVNGVVSGSVIHTIFLLFPVIIILSMLLSILMILGIGKGGEKQKMSFDEFVKHRYNQFFDFIKMREHELEEFYKT
jgi:hypothetical protein